MNHIDYRLILELLVRKIQVKINHEIHYIHK